MTVLAYFWLSMLTLGLIANVITLHFLRRTLQTLEQRLDVQSQRLDVGTERLDVCNRRIDGAAFSAVVRGRPGSA